jgi:HSP20 family protein
MKLSLPILIAASAIPVSADAWSTGGQRVYFGPSIAAKMLLDMNNNNVDSMNLMRQRMQQRRDCFNNNNNNNANNALMTRVSPRYEIKDSDKEIMISLDVPGVKAEDIHVSIEEGDSVLSIQGRRESSDGTTTTSRRFAQSFSLDPSIDLDRFTATLNNGVLVITAPKDLQRLEKNLRRIPVMTVGGGGGGGTTASATGLAVEPPVASADIPVEENNKAAPTVDTSNDETIDLDDAGTNKEA